MNKDKDNSFDISKLLPFFVRHVAHEIFFNSPSGRIIYANEFACKKLGYPTKEIKKLHVSNLDPRFSDRKREKTWNYIKKSQKTTFRSVHRTKSGETYPVRITSHYLKFNGKEYEVAFARDISQINKIEKKLKKERNALKDLFDQYNSVLDTAAIWINKLDLEGNVVYWNQKAEQISGYTAAEVTGHDKIWEWLYPDPDYREKIIKKVEKIIHNKTKEEGLRTQIRTKSGEYRYIRWYSNSIVERGKLAGSIALGLDVTEKIRAEDKIKKSEEKFRTLSESVSAIIWEYDIQKDSWTYVSPRSEDLLGYKPREWTDLDFWKEHIHPKDREKAFKYCMACSKKLKDHDFEYRFIKKNKDIVWLYDSVNVESEKGKPVKIRGTMLDITEKKQAENFMNNQLRLNKLITRISSNFIEVNGGNIDEKIDWMLKKCGRFFNADRSYFFRLSANRPVKFGIYEWCDEGTRSQKEKNREFSLDNMEWCRKKLEDEKVFYLTDLDRLPPEASKEKEILKKQNINSFLCIPVKDKKENLLGFIRFDFIRSIMSIDKKQLSLLEILSNVLADALDSLKNKKRLVQIQKMESMGRLAGGVAHEINNPLGSILATAQLLLEETGEDDPVYEDLKVIEEATKRSASIVKKLLKFSRKESQKIEKINLNQIIQNVLSMINRQVEFKGIHIETDLADDLPPVEAAGQNMVQVFLNLLINARDAMPEGGTVTITTTDYKKRADRYVTASVKDTGTGIEEDILGKLFEPYYTTKKSGAGTGLGLSIVKNILTGVDGEIEVETEPGRGSEFKIKIPVA